MQTYIYTIQTVATIKPYIVLHDSATTLASSIENTTCIHGLNIYFDLSKNAVPAYQFCQYTPNLTIIAPSNDLKLELTSNYIVLKQPHRYEIQYSSYNGKVAQYLLIACRIKLFITNHI